MVVAPPGGSGSSGPLAAALRWAVVVCLAFSVTACGFHLRTWNLSSSVSSVYVTSNPRNPIEMPLERALRQAGVAEAATSEAAGVVVDLLDFRKERSNAVVSGQGQVAEYRVTLGVRYRVVDGEGHDLVPAQWLERDRVFSIDRNNIVGSSQEQSLLEGEIQNDLVQQILRSISAAVAGQAHAG